MRCFTVHPPYGRHLAQQVPRSDNSAAHKAAHRALDNGDLMEICGAEHARFAEAVAGADGCEVGSCSFSMGRAEVIQERPHVVSAHGGASSKQVSSQAEA